MIAEETLVHLRLADLFAAGNPPVGRGYAEGVTAL